MQFPRFATGLILLGRPSAMAWHCHRRVDHYGEQCQHTSGPKRFHVSIFRRFEPTDKGNPPSQSSDFADYSAMQLDRRSGDPAIDVVCVLQDASLRHFSASLLSLRAIEATRLNADWSFARFRVRQLNPLLPVPGRL